MFEILSYRELLRSRIEALRASRPGFTLQKAAMKAGLQPPYLTNVLKERAHLSSDQLFKLGVILELSEEESEYALKLLEWERSGVAARKAKLREGIEVLRKEKLKVKANLKKEVLSPDSEAGMRFYLNPFYKIVYTFLDVERFRKQPELIAASLRLSRGYVDQLLKDLVEMGYAKHSARGYEALKKSFHLPRESPLCEPHQALMQRAATQHVQSLPESDKFGFALSFTANEETRQKVQRAFIKFLQSIEGDVKDADSEEVYGLSFELFRWSHD